MGLRINQNIAALNAHRNLSITDVALSKSLERLSSGLRINRAADDAAGLAISEKLRGQVGGLKGAIANAQDGIKLIETAEGALNEVSSILQRMRELAVQAANDTATDEDRAQIQKEVNQLIAEIKRISATTEFNTKKLLNGSITGNVEARSASAEISANERVGSTPADFITSVSANASVDEDAVIQLKVISDGTNTSVVVSKATSTGAPTEVTTVAAEATAIEVAVGSGTVTITVAAATSTDAGKVAYVKVLGAIDAVTTDNSLAFMIGANQGQVVKLGIADMSSESLRIEGLKVDTMLNAQNAIGVIDWAINRVSTERAKLGALENRLEHTIANLGIAQENLTAAESRIRDVDMALEVSKLTRNQVLLQSGVAMLAQANASPQAVLALLR
jgi:flagellin